MLAISRSVSGVDDLVQSLGTVSELWLNPQHPLRTETVQALQVSTGFSQRQVEIGIANCFEELTKPRIIAYVDSLDQVQRSNLRVLHILPSNVFTAWVHGAIITLLLGHRCLLKPSSREPVFARAWRKSIEEIDSSLAKSVEVVDWDERLLHDCQAVVAYGSDETLVKIRSKLPSGMRFAGYGHKLSVAVIFQEALEASRSEELLDTVRRDAEPFRLRGCLSPQVLYIQNPQWIRWPDLEALVDISPKIRPFKRWDEVRQELSKFVPFLSCVGYAGSSEHGDFLKRELRNHGISRICPVGEMQHPSLSWPNGGIDLVNLLH